MDPRDALLTPKLDAEAPELLQRVTEQGGYAFSTSAALASRGDLRAAEVAREMAWEQLHAGPWTSVLPVWRDAYSMACLYVAKARYAREEFNEAVRVLEMGLNMGGTLLRSDLDAAVQKLSSKTTCGDNSAVSKEASVDGNEEEEEDESQKSDCELHQLINLTRSIFGKVVCRRSGVSLEVFLFDYFLLGTSVVKSDIGRQGWSGMTWNT